MNSTKKSDGKFLAFFLLILGLFTHPVASGRMGHSHSGAKAWWPKEQVPKALAPAVFEDTETRVVIMAGRDALLPCRVRNLNDKVVSWIRTKDLHILTSGPVTFTADDRFDCDHDPDSSDWSLRLRKTQTTDSGVYECQVNTDPKINRKITLDVVSGFVPYGNSIYGDAEPRMVDDEGESPLREGALTRILGKEEQFVKTGSTITFTCLVVVPEEPVSSIDWLKNGRQVSFQASRGGIIVDTEKSERKATSRLTMADVTPGDSGNYTCKPGNAKSHSVALVVVEGERTQAMQRHKNRGNEGRLVNRMLLLATLCLISFLIF